MPRGDRNTCKESPEHLVPGSEGWSRSEGCPQTLWTGFRATWEPARRAPSVGGWAWSVSTQGPQCWGAGTERQPAEPPVSGGGHGASARRAPSVGGRARSVTSTACRGLSSSSSGKTEPLFAHVWSSWRPTHFIKWADKGRESNASLSLLEAVCQGHRVAGVGWSQHGSGLAHDEERRRLEGTGGNSDEIWAVTPPAADGTGRSSRGVQNLGWRPCGPPDPLTVYREHCPGSPYPLPRYRQHSADTADCTHRWPAGGRGRGGSTPSD